MNHETTQSAAKPVMTVEQFCEAHEISRPFFCKLNRNGQGPEVIKIGRRVLITSEAAAAWRERHTVRGGRT